MTTQPTLRTRRLVLRPFTVDDAPQVQLLAGDSRVADTTLHIPHPYVDGMAEAWIDTHAAAFEHGALAVFAVIQTDHPLIGAVSLRLEDHRRAELGYWIGVPYWRMGFATEAVVAVIGYGFEAHGLHRIHASHLVRNPASGRVMTKAGMQFEGVQRQHILKNGRFEDLAGYGILATDPRPASG